MPGSALDTEAEPDVGVPHYHTSSSMRYSRSCRISSRQRRTW